MTERQRMDIEALYNAEMREADHTTERGQYALIRLSALRDVAQIMGYEFYNTVDRTYTLQKK